MEYLALGLAAFLGGVACGFAGFAHSAVAGAILLHVLEPLLAIPLMMSCSILSQVTLLSDASTKRGSTSRCCCCSWSRAR